MTLSVHESVDEFTAIAQGLMRTWDRLGITSFDRLAELCGEARSELLPLQTDGYDLIQFQNRFHPKQGTANMVSYHTYLPTVYEPISIGIIPEDCALFRLMSPLMIAHYTQEGISSEGYVSQSRFLIRPSVEQVRAELDSLARLRVERIVLS